MHRVVEVKPLLDFKVRLKFLDGVEGTVDLSDVAGKGVFSSWAEITGIAITSQLTHA